jgi:4-amino-4-deoxy-L-arabinose transferase-like glycosyltransferase
MLSKNKALLLLIVFLAAFFRFSDLGLCPSWDYDEGVNMNISWNLLNGQFLWFNHKYAFVPHPPLFFIVVGTILKIFGNELIILRSLSAFYGILTTIVLYCVGKEMIDERFGLLMSFLFAIYPNAIFFGRLGFANNQLVFISVLAFFLFIKYLKNRDNRIVYTISIITGLAPVTEAGGFALLLSINLFFMAYDRKNSLKVLLISTAPLALFVAVMLLTVPNAFVHDITFNLQRLKPQIDETQKQPDIFWEVPIVLSSFLLSYALYHSRKKIKSLYQNLILFLFSSFFPRITSEEINAFLRDNLALCILSLSLYMAPSTLSLSHRAFFDGFPDYFLIGLLGLFLISKKQTQNIVFLFSIPQMAYFLRAARTDHMMLPLYIYFTMGLAFLLLWLHEHFKSSPRLSLIAKPAFILLIVPILIVLYTDISLFILAPDFSAEDAEAHIKLAEYLNNNTNLTDIVVVDVHTARLVKSRVSEPMLSYATDNRRIVYMDPGLGSERFIFNASYRNVKYFVLLRPAEELKREEKYYDLIDIMDDISKWPLVRIRNYYIYKNPNL